MTSNMSLSRFASSRRHSVRFDNVGCLFSDGDDGGSGVPADLVRENRSIDDAEVFNAKHAQVRIDDSCLGRGADARGRRLQKKKKDVVRPHTEDRGWEGGNARGEMLRRSGHE